VSWASGSGVIDGCFIVNHRIDLPHVADFPFDVGYVGDGQRAHRAGLVSAQSGWTDTHGDQRASLDGAGSVRDGRTVKRHRAVGTAHHSHAAPIVERRHSSDEGGLPNG